MSRLRRSSESDVLDIGANWAIDAVLAQLGHLEITQFWNVRFPGGLGRTLSQVPIS